MLPVDGAHLHVYLQFRAAAAIFLPDAGELNQSAGPDTANLKLLLLPHFDPSVSHIRGGDDATPSSQ